MPPNEAHRLAYPRLCQVSASLAAATPSPGAKAVFDNIPALAASLGLPPEAQILSTVAGAAVVLGAAVAALATPPEAPEAETRPAP